MNMEEIWKDIPGYEGLYMASNLGSIKTFHNRNGVKFLKKAVGTTGYVKAVLVKDGKKYYAQVHILICTTYHGKNPGNMVVNHIDGNKQNNNIDNLEWVTESYNMYHAFNILKVGVKPVLQFDKNMKLISEFHSAKVAQDSTNISKVNIGQCCRHERKTAGGFIWRFKNEQT